MLNSVLEYLNRAAENHHDKVAFIELNRKVTYGEFVKEAKYIAHSILQYNRYDKRPIVVFLDKTIDSLLSFMGIVYSGNIYVPFDVSAPVNRLNTILEVLKPAYLITDNIHMEKARQLSISEEQVLNIKELNREQLIKIDLNKISKQYVDTDPLYIIYTSGSTGIPKGTVISHRAVIDFVEESSGVMEFSDMEVFANQAPFYFDASVPDIYCTIRNGATLHILPKTLFGFPVKLLQYIHDNNINAIFWVPSALILLANFRALGKVDISCLKKIMFCGEVMPNKQLNVWRKYLPQAKYVNYYGPSETTYASTYYIVDREFRDDEVLPIGKPAINTGVLILDENNQPVNGQEIGELCIRGSGVGFGYYNDAIRTGEAFVQNPLHSNYMDIIYRTGDLVKYNKYGEIEYVCRKDFQIKHLGYRIELGEIEAAATTLTKIERVCCIYNEGRKEIVLIVKGGENISDIKKKLLNLLPSYMFPGKIVQVDEMPINANGKIDRAMLMKKYGKK